MIISFLFIDCPYLVLDYFVHYLRLFEQFLDIHVVLAEQYTQLADRLDCECSFRHK